jgi:hypothetical protein
MFKLIRLNPDSFVIIGERYQFAGTLNATIRYMASIDVEWGEIELAMTELERLNHDVADFVILKRFTFTKAA